MEPRRQAGEELFIRQFDRIKRTIASVAWKKRLDADEAQELDSLVFLKIVQDDFAVLRKYQKKSDWGTYLHVVVVRVLLDARAQRWGRWRPCARAQQIGPTAIELDRLMHRVGWSPDEAVRVLSARGCEASSEKLELLAARLQRHPSRRSVALDPHLDTLAGSESADRQVELKVGRAKALELVRAFRNALQEFPVEDRRLLELRYGAGWTVQRIAREQALDARRLYRRFERLLMRLRQQLVAAGLDWTQVASTLEPDVDLDLGLEPALRGRAPDCSDSGQATQ